MLTIQEEDQGGIFPRLLCMSRLDEAERKITLYNDALQTFAASHRLPFQSVRTFALLHEHLHFLFPRNRKHVEQLSTRLIAALGIIDSQHDH